MKVLNFGSCNLDYTYALPHIVAVGETVGARSMQTNPGGKGLNQSVALARAGIPVFHAGRIGKDGAMLADVLRAAGADISHLMLTDGNTGNAVIQVGADGSNAIVVYAGENGRVTREQIDETLADFSAGDYLVSQNEISEVSYLIRRAAARGMRVCLNPSPFDERMRDVDFTLLDTLMVNEVEAEQIAGAPGIDAFLCWVKANCPALRVVLTLGGAGCVFYENGTLVRQSAFAVPVADTTAAGDTFTGFYLSARVRGMQTAEALRVASAASAIAVSRPGAASSIPLWDEVIAALPSMTEKGAG